jgi:hypothetical protein
VTRAASPPRLAVGTTADATAGTAAATRLDHASNAVRSVPILMRT